MHMVLLGVPRKKSPVTPPGIDPGTFRLVAQCLNHYATPGPLKLLLNNNNNNDDSNKNYFVLCVKEFTFVNDERGQLDRTVHYS